MGHATGAADTWTLTERPEPVRFLIRDHDAKFTGGFDGCSNNVDVFGLEYGRFKHPRRMGSPSGSSGPPDQNAWIGS